MPDASTPRTTDASTPDAVPDASTPHATDTGTPDPAARFRPSGWRLVLAIALPIVAVAVIVVLADRVRAASAPDPDAALAVPVVLQTGSTSAGCSALDARLPDSLDDRARRTLVVSEPGVAAWGSPPAVLRCGITDPAELTCSAQLTVLNGVAWLPLTGDDATTYVAVDRAQRIALTVPDDVGIGVVQALSNVVREAMPERPVCVDGVVNPTAA
ncbi:DUF3515 domain-containing protein [Nakamurella deserti]|uniref:DUF3515 domain-containing protein n=1 Tax=Nakamurella deserti TaxID=2164074 RepID=UPI001300BCAF|nr:DUF3515 domain-containing protein [Nakamurella deserti]